MSIFDRKRPLKTLKRYMSRFFTKKSSERVDFIDTTRPVQLSSEEMGSPGTGGYNDNDPEELNPNDDSIVSTQSIIQDKDKDTKVDTEESAAVDTAIEQQRRTEFLTATVQFLQAIGPLVASGAVGFEQAKQMLLFAAKAFPGARDLEETLEAIQPPQPGPSPSDKLVEVEAAKVQAQTQQAAADAQVKVARLQLDQQKAAQDAQFKQQKLEIDAAKVVTQ